MTLKEIKGKLNVVTFLFYKRENISIDKFKKSIGKNKCKHETEIRGKSHFCSYYNNNNRMFNF